MITLEQQAAILKPLGILVWTGSNEADFVDAGLAVLASDHKQIAFEFYFASLPVGRVVQIGAGIICTNTSWEHLSRDVIRALHRNVERTENAK